MTARVRRVVPAIGALRAGPKALRTQTVSIEVLMIAALSLVLTACNWVDSAGSSRSEVAPIRLFLDDEPIDDLLTLNEQSEYMLTVVRNNTSSPDQNYTITELPAAGETSQQLPPPRCTQRSDFNESVAKIALAPACTDPDECSFTFEPVANDAEGVRFRIQVPQLKAPVGLRYRISAISENDAGENSTDVETCLIAINEAPVAVNDTFSVIEGQSFSTTVRNLLSNDSDDVDESNQPLQVLSEPVEGPMFAESFQLRADGSFDYVSNLAGIQQDQIDRFVYQLSDGRQTSTATVSIRIVSSNQAPRQIADIATIEAEEGELLLENLGEFFIDPERAELSFELAEDTPLPDQGSLVLGTNGVLSGVPATQDVGSYLLRLIVSDGGATLEVPLTLTITPAPLVPENFPPEYVQGTVSNRLVSSGSSMRPIIPTFIDPDSDTLRYRMADGRTLPEGVEIDENTGIVSGTPFASAFNLRIEATDPAGESAESDSFFIFVTLN